jgi:hypothetical protein
VYDTAPTTDIVAVQKRVVFSTLPDGVLKEILKTSLPDLETARAVFPDLESSSPFSFFINPRSSLCSTLSANADGQRNKKIASIQLTKVTDDLTITVISIVKRPSATD